MQAGPVISLSPSFNSYSNTRLAGIVARVVEEFQSEDFYDEFYFEREDDSATRLSQTEDDPETERFQPEENSEHVEKGGGGDEDDDDGEFEFKFETGDSKPPSPIPADEIFLNGQIRPVYPISNFDRDLLFGHLKFRNEIGKGSGFPDSDSLKGSKIRLPLRKLFVEERETTLTTTSSSSSSSEGDDLEGLPADTYCVRRPKTAEERCKKSSSTGSISKRWNLKGLLQRSLSDGKDSFVFLNSGNRMKENGVKVKGTPVGGGKDKPTTLVPPPPPYNRDGGEKRRSYLPYRQDLVGFFW